MRLYKIPSSYTQIQMTKEQQSYKEYSWKEYCDCMLQFPYADVCASDYPIVSEIMFSKPMCLSSVHHVYGVAYCATMGMGSISEIAFQDPATPIMEGINDLHNEVMTYIIFVFVSVSFVLYMTLRMFDRKNAIFNKEWIYWTPSLYNGLSYRLFLKPKKYSHNTTLEIVWTIFPIAILILIAIPSFALLYTMEEIIEPGVTLRVIGHQWWWEYEYPDFENAKREMLIVESRMIPEEDLELGQFRLLDVDNRTVLPIKTHIRVLVTSTDVLHSWAVPAFGIKVDAVPGRINQTTLFIKREGVYYGQCSELCGAHHGFMPICVEAVPLDEFKRWIYIEKKMVPFNPKPKIDISAQLEKAANSTEPKQKPTLPSPYNGLYGRIILAFVVGGILMSWASGLNKLGEQILSDSQ